jgi:hypothetical protein
MESVFSDLLKSIAQIIDNFEHKPIVDNDINISNWITQVLSNEDFEHKMHLIGKVNGHDFDFTTKDRFNPSTQKGNANAYQESMRKGKFICLKDKTYIEFTPVQYSDAIQILLAYVLGWICLGKPLSSVNMARGKILLCMIESLKITELNATIFNISLGGSKPKVNLDINQAELTLLAKYHDLRSKRIMSRDDNASNKNGHVNAVTTDAVTTLKPFQL